ncbi:hypothetical protein ACFWA6_09525 [Streptomyces sp. NPDC060020]|uniref:hypothetical protein n=1 Tax=Streptomyces sp. NPDC060020 TaxID=3347038 RepID=UPI0036854745
MPSLAKAQPSAVRTYNSPADRTVRTVLPAGSGRAVTVPGQSAAGNPDLALDISGSTRTALGLEITSEITSADVTLEVVVDWGDGTTDKSATKGSGKLKNKHTYTEVGEYQVKVTVTDVVNGVQAVNGLTHLTQGTEFTPHAPTRLLDTRDGTGTKAGKVSGRGTTRVKVAGTAGIPADVEAVALNVTVTNTTGDGHVTVWEGDDFGIPETSNLNYKAGQSVPNMVIVPVGSDGYVDLFNGGWQSVDLIADITGYFTHSPSSGYTTMNPTRFVDTREGLGTAKGQLAGRGTFATRISGLNGVPQGITAVALNVTVTNPKEAGHLSVFPGGSATPTASNLNFTAGQTVANSVIVPVSPDGKISLFNGAWAPTDVVVDVVGYYSKDSKAAYVVTGSYRIIDTRESWWRRGKLPAHSYLSQRFTSDDRGPADAYVLNATVTNTSDSGFLSVAPSPFPWLENDQPGAPVPPRPGSSTLNWEAGQTTSNLVQASDGDHGIINFWNQGWKDADLIIDVFGVYQTS